MYPVLFKIGPLTIYSLGFLWALAAFAGAWILRLENETEERPHLGFPKLAKMVVLNSQY